ncbi:MAG: DUF3048 domain-containing protein [Chloroflexota bacterium]
MIRPSLPWLIFGSLLLTGCGSTATATVTAHLGAKSLPAIKLPAYIPGPLDGESTPRNDAMRRSLAVVLENYAPDSRPQAGLSGASTVFETLAEGGVTRFMALYLEHDATKVGPVRSTRMYFDRWAAGFHSILAHVGGNDDAQALLWHLPKVFNIDENRWEKSLVNTGTTLFWRSTDRVAPHNMYTSTFRLRRFASQNKQDWQYTQAYFPHKVAASLAQRGRATVINLTFENPLFPQVNADYNVQYQYDRRSNTYLRFMGGTRHVDSNTGKQLAPSNVIVLRTKNASPDPNAGPTPESILIPTIGSGAAWFFRDGKIVAGNWQQLDQNAPLQLNDSRGRAVLFNPGQIWIEVVPASSGAAWSVH